MQSCGYQEVRIIGGHFGNLPTTEQGITCGIWWMCEVKE